MRRYLDHLAVERGLSRNSLSAYRRDLNRYLGWLADSGVNDLAEVDEAQVEAFLGYLRRGDTDHQPLAASSCARTIVSVRGLHRFTAQEGRVATDRAAGVRPPPIPKRLPRALSIDQVEALLAAAGPGPSVDTGLDAGLPVGAAPASSLGHAAGAGRGPGASVSVGAGPDAETGVARIRDRALLEVLYGTGARISEAVGLDIDDVDLDGGAVRLLGKGGKERVVPIGRLAITAVRAYLVRARPALIRRGTPALLLSARGNRLSRQTGWTILQVAAERAKIDPALVSPHVLRHSYATHLLDGGADVRVVQELLGHASVTTTQVYTLVTVDRLREVYATAHPRARS
jgi:integrase/recombinase XerD